MLGNIKKKILKLQIILGLSPPPEMEILSVLVKIS